MDNPIPCLVVHGVPLILAGILALAWGREDECPKRSQPCLFGTSSSLPSDLSKRNLWMITGEVGKVGQIYAIEFQNLDPCQRFFSNIVLQIDLQGWMESRRLTCLISDHPSRVNSELRLELLPQHSARAA